MKKDWLVIKKNGNEERWSRAKLMKAINKAGVRARSYIYSDETVLSQKERSMLYGLIETKVENSGLTRISTEILHSFIIEALDVVAPDIAKIYKDYHNWRITEAEEYENVMKSIDSLATVGNLDNANSDAMIVSMQNNLAACFVEESRLKNFFLTKEELEAIKLGFIYIHDKDHRMLYPYNCALFNCIVLLLNGFEVNGVQYTVPKSIDVMFDVLGDIIISATAAQYGGFTISRMENLIAIFAEKSYKKEYEEELKKLVNTVKEVLDVDKLNDLTMYILECKADKIAKDKIEYAIRQGYQGIEVKLNTVASSRGDYPFTTITFGNTLYGNYWAEKAVEIMLDVRKKGQGTEGKKKPVIFPKLIFLYDEMLHGKGQRYEYLFDRSVECSIEAMYPDTLSLTGCGYVADIYCRYNGIERVFSEDGKEVIDVKIKEGYLDGRFVPLDDPRRKEAKYSHEHPEVSISSMGCRSFLSPWYAHNEKDIQNKALEFNSRKHERLPMTKYGFLRIKDKKTGYVYATNVKDHFYPMYEEEVPIYEGRQNNGVVSLNLPLIYQYCKENNIYFYDKLSYYLEMIRRFHLRSIERNGDKKASVNPYAFMYGGLIDINGKPCRKRHNEKIKSVLQCGTTSFGVTALNELQLLYNGQTIRQAMEQKRDDGTVPFVENVVDFINDKIARFKDEDNVLHSLYATPAEKLSGTQLQQFKALYPNVKIKGFTNNDWVSNSFHIHVSEEITPSEKQDLEFDLFHKVTGGRIQYVRIDGKFNFKAVKDIIRRGMRMGFYQGVNIDMSFCESCGFRFDSKNMSVNNCPKCGSVKITTAARLCGYLGYVRRGSYTEIDEGGNIKGNGNRVNIPMVHNIQARKCM